MRDKAERLLTGGEKGNGGTRRARPVDKALYGEMRVDGKGGI